MSPPHYVPLRQQLIRSVSEECGGPRAVAFDPNARAYEAFACGLDNDTRLLEPLAATSLKDALAETTSRWSWDRGSRLAVREIGHRRDLLHVYAVRRKAQANYTYHDHVRQREFERWLEHVCTIDLNIVAGIDMIGVGSERDIFEHRQARRPEGARR